MAANIPMSIQEHIMFLAGAGNASPSLSGAPPDEAASAAAPPAAAPAAAALSAASLAPHAPTKIPAAAAAAAALVPGTAPRLTPGDVFVLSQNRGPGFIIIDNFLGAEAAKVGPLRGRSQ